MHHAVDPVAPSLTSFGVVAGDLSDIAFLSPKMLIASKSSACFEVYGR